MSRGGDRSSRTPEALLAAERELSPASRQTRERVMKRVRASLDEGSLVHRPQPGTRRGMKRALNLVALPVVLGGTWALAFQVGHELTAPEGSTARVEQPLLPSGLPTRSWVLPPLVLQPEEAAEVHVAEDPPVPSARSTLTSTRSGVDAYALELPVLQPAQRAVARRDFASALAAIAEHQAQFPSGVLAEEREALRVRVFVGLGRMEDARRAAQSFRKRFPKSALHDRIDRMLRSPG